MKNIQKYFKSIKSQKGDTIVEVSLALTVLALVLGTSSVLANRNSRTLQTSQENTYALRVAQGQLEYVKSFAATHTAQIPTSAATFCMQNATTKLNNPTTNPNCKQPDGGAVYQKQISSVPVGDNRYDVTARVQWDTLTGIPGNVELTYRIYKKLGAGEARGEGDTCPAGTSGIVPNCTPNTPSIKVTVRKIAPNAGNNTPDCSKVGSQSSGGTAVRLSGPTAKQQNIGSGQFETIFTNLEPFNFYQAQINGVPSGFQVCPPNTSNLTQARADSTPNLEFKIRPICWQEQRRGSDVPVYSEWRHDVIGWVPSQYGNYRWERGARGGDGYLTDAWYGWMGQSTQVGPYPNGKYYWLEWDGRIRSDGGAYWYNVWEAVWRYDVIEYAPVYGPWYRVIIRWDPTYYTVNICPS